MAQKHIGSKRARVLWCVWFALLMSAPYAPGTGSMATIGWGAASTSKVFAYVAAGIVMGLWWGTLPRVERMTVGSPAVRAGVDIAGGLLSAAVLAATWTNLVLVLFCVPEYAMSWEVVLLDNEQLSLLGRLLVPMIDAMPFAALVAAFFCGWAAIGAFYSMGPACKGSVGESGQFAGIDALLGMAADLRDSLGPSSLLRLVAVFLMGAIQPLAWVLLMPHNSSFPQPLIGVDSIGSLWDMGSLGFGLGLLCLPFAVLLALSLLCMMPPKQVKDDMPILLTTRSMGLVPLASLCMGLLLFRVLVRVCPAILRVELGTAGVFLGLYALLAGTVFAMLWHHRSCLDKACEDQLVSIPAQTGDDSLSIERDLTQQERDLLLSQGLTEKEMLVVCAYMKGLTSAQAGAAMGIAEATVREYRRRCRVKIDVSTMDELVEWIHARTAEDALPLDSHTDGAIETGGIHVAARASNGKRYILEVTALAAAVFVSAALLFPAAGCALKWDDVWTTGFGLAGGFAMAWVALFVAGLCLRAGKILDKKGLACLLTVFAASSFTFALMQGGIVTVGSGTLYRAVRLTCISLLSMSATVMLRYMLWLFDLPRDYACRFVLPVLVVSGIGGLVFCQLENSVWLATVLLALTCCIALVLAVVVCVVKPEADQSVGQGTLVPSGCRFSWLLAFGLVMWLWEEIWRAQGFESSADFMQWGVLLLLGIALVKQKRILAVEPAVLLMALVVLLISGLLTGVARVVVLVYCLLAGFSAVYGDEPHGGYVQGRPWHSPLISGAFCLVVGTLVSNVVGSVSAVDIVDAIVLALDSDLFIGLGILAVVVLAVALCVWDIAAGDVVSLSLAGEERVRTTLMARGLSLSQIDIALLLAQGLSVSEAARELHYSRSTVALAHRQCYAALGVADRASLVVALETLAGQSS